MNLNLPSSITPYNSTFFHTHTYHKCESPLFASIPCYFDISYYQPTVFLFLFISFFISFRVAIAVRTSDCSEAKVALAPKGYNQPTSTSHRSTPNPFPRLFLSFQNPSRIPSAHLAPLPLCNVPLRKSLVAKPSLQPLFVPQSSAFLQLKNLLTHTHRP